MKTVIALFILGLAMPLVLAAIAAGIMLDVLLRLEQRQSVRVGRRRRGF
ncbi:hypothetical protein [Nostoc linckia]|nr:hypothetical protein [Nostoc linckia]